MFKKWDLIYASRFPEAIKCENKACPSYIVAYECSCPQCGRINIVSNIAAKIRPVLIWIDQSRWFESMTFAIPLSASNLHDDSHNQCIYLSDYAFLHVDLKYNRPMRAM